MDDLEHREIPKPPNKDAYGNLLVSIVPRNEGTTLFNEVSNIPKDVETNLVSFTVPAEKSFYVQGGSAFGMTDGIFSLYIDGLKKEILGNAWTQRNVNFCVREKVESGKEIKITVKHWAGNMHDFNASIFGELI